VPNAQENEKAMVGVTRKSKAGTKAPRSVKAGEITLLIILILFGYCMLYPFLWMLFTSFKPLPEVYTTGFFYHGWAFRNYIDVWGKINLTGGLKASVFFSVGLTVSQLLTSSMAGYAFAKIKFPAKNVCFFIVLASMTIPYVTIMLPQYMMLEQFGIVSNGPWGYIIPRLSGGAATIFFVRQYCYGIPDALIESAKMDGASQGKIFFRVILQGLIPPVTVQGLFIFIFIWNDYLGPSVFLIDKNWWTIQLYVARFSSGQIGSAGAANVPMQMTVAVIITLPLLIMFLYAQKHIVNSLMASGIKE
jgi:multiple sugar transport system permease protein